VVFIARGISAEEILTSLEAFRPMIGAGPLPIETNAPV
jgi:hypothetical protein